MKIDRSIQPILVTPKVLNVPTPVATLLDNGITLHSLNVGDIEVVRLSLVFRAGTRYQDMAFMASTTLGMIGEGSSKYTSEQTAQQFDFYGSHFDVNIDRDYSVITICAISKFLPQTLELLEDIVINPTYDPQELKSYVDKRKQQLTIERENPSYRARELFGNALFGATHPYGCSYDQELYDQLNSDVLKDFHKKVYTANDCIAVCSGHLTDHDISAISNMVNKLPRGCGSSAPVIPSSITTTQIKEHRQGAVQSAIRIGRIMFNRNHQDFNGMQVLTTILGGYFGSRLVTNLREEKGYTYGVFSTMVNLEHSGYLAIATEVATEVTDDAVAQIYYEMERLKEEPVAAEELTSVKNIMIGELMRILDGPFGITDVTIENLQNNMDNNYVTDFVREIQSITSERLQQLAQKYFTKEQFCTVIVGDIENMKN